MRVVLILLLYRIYIYLGERSTGHLIRNKKAGPGWISYLRIGDFYTNFSITTREFLILQYQPVFLIARFLGTYSYICVSCNVPATYTIRVTGTCTWYSYDVFFSITMVHCCTFLVALFGFVPQVVPGTSTRPQSIVRSHTGPGCR